VIRRAAQGEVVHNDDTRMKILALARASPDLVGLLQVCCLLDSFVLAV